jgi:hypothetical protein
MAGEVVESLWALPAFVLLTFRHLHHLEVVANDPDKSFSVQMAPWPGAENERSIVDTRQSNTQHWRLAKRSLNPPAEELAEFEDEDDRRHAAEVSVAVATLLDAQGQVTPLSMPMMLHVYYPTEEPAPIPVLLHADFVVKSDRTRVVPDSRFNAWLSESLALHVVDCVEQWYSGSAPTANLKLLLPTKDVATSAIAANLWQRIEEHAKRTLKLPDASGNRVLSIALACRIATSVGPELARQIFAKCGYASRLVHPSLETDTQAQRVLDKLGCAKLTDDDLFAAIADAPPETARDAEWLWACWHWVAGWAAAQRQHDWKPDARNRRLLQLRKTRILALGGQTTSLESVGTNILTWRDAALQPAMPEWMPLLFVDDWLRDRILSAATDSPLRLLLRELSIEEPSLNLLLKGLAHAIADFWKTKQGDASRFLAFLAASSFQEQFDASGSLQRCPVRVKIEGKTSDFYVEASRAYFGWEWGEELIAQLYNGVQGIAWAKKPVENVEAHKAILTWLGVPEYPRLVLASESSTTNVEQYRVWRRLPNHTSVGEIPAREVFDGIDVASLDQKKARALLHLLVRHWPYYSSHVSVSVSYKYRTWYCESVPAAWWEELKSKLLPPLTQNYSLPMPLERCWLPDKATRRAAGALLPTIDLASFGDGRTEVEKWLIQHVGVRTQLSQIPAGEWREILKDSVPRAIPAKDAALDGGYQKVMGWYEACLESLSAQEADSSLSNVPLLCRKGGAWDYIAQESRWLADDNELSEAFSADVWQIDFPERLHSDARKHLGLAPLSDAKLEPHWDSTTGHAHAHLQMKLDFVKPYIFVWRCYKTKQDHEQLRTHLHRLRIRVAERLEAEVRLTDSLPPKLVRKSVAAAGDTLLLGESKADLPRLSEALALAVRTPSDADFFENLLRCESDADRIQKLEARNCPPEQIQRLLQEFRSSAEPERVETTPSPGAPVEPRSTPSSQESTTIALPVTMPTPVSVPSQVVGDGAPNSKPTTEISATGSSTSALPVPESSRPAESKTTELHHAEREVQAKAPTELNHPDSVPAEFVEVGAHTRSRPQRARRQQQQDTRPDSESGLASVTSAEKDVLEQCGREYASRELQRMGYKVTPMDQRNPGYDLLAQKPGDTLKVEVKAHSGEATNVFVTQREWEEYLRTLQRHDERWELWNVENLAAGKKPKIKPIRHIPKSVPKVSGFWIDLNQCSSHLPVEANKP